LGGTLLECLTGLFVGLAAGGQLAAVLFQILPLLREPVGLVPQGGVFAVKLGQPLGEPGAFGLKLGLALLQLGGTLGEGLAFGLEFSPQRFQPLALGVELGQGLGIGERLVDPFALLAEGVGLGRQLRLAPGQVGGPLFGLSLLLLNLAADGVELLLGGLEIFGPLLQRGAKLVHLRAGLIELPALRSQVLGLPGKLRRATILLGPHGP